MTDNNARAAIWDVDGTLVDTAELHFQAWVEVAREIDKPFTRDDFAATFGRRNPEIIRQLFDPAASESWMRELGARKEDLYREEARRGVTLLPGVRELLAGLHAAGWRQAVGSSAPRENLDLILRITDTKRYFDAIVSMEDTQRGKPDPEVFLTAAAKLRVAPERCVVFEDAVAGVEAAKAGGMKCVAVRFVGHHPEEKLKTAGADLVVASLEDVSVKTLQTLFS